MPLPTPINITRIPKTGTPCYVLVCNTSKKIVACQYGDFNYSTPSANTVIIAATYAELSAKATAAGITGLPAQAEGQP